MDHQGFRISRMSVFLVLFPKLPAAPTTFRHLCICIPGADSKGFHSLLQAIEAEDTEGRIEIHIYLTAKIEYVPVPVSVSNPFLVTSPSSLLHSLGAFIDGTGRTWDLGL